MRCAFAHKMSEDISPLPKTYVFAYKYAQVGIKPHNDRRAGVTPHTPRQKFKR